MNPTSNNFDQNDHGVEKFENEKSLVSVMMSNNDRHESSPAPVPRGLSSSFFGPATAHEDGNHDDVPMTDDEEEKSGLKHVEQKLERMEVYDPEYQTSLEEKEELKQLAIDLGLFRHRTGHHNAASGDAQEGTESLVSSTLSPETLSVCNPDLRKLFSCADDFDEQEEQQQQTKHRRLQEDNHGHNSKRKKRRRNFSMSDATASGPFVAPENHKRLDLQQSILLKRGKIKLHDDTLHELILLTHGFILARVERGYRMMDGSLKIPLVYERCVMYDNVEFVKDLRYHHEEEKGQANACRVCQKNEGDRHSVSVSFYGSSAHLHSLLSHIEFRCKDEEDKNSWLSAFRTVLTQNRMNKGGASTKNGDRRRRRRTMMMNNWGDGRQVPSPYSFIKSIWMDDVHDVVLVVDACAATRGHSAKHGSLPGISVQSMLKNLATEELSSH